LWYCEGDSDGITCYNQGYLTSNCDPSNPNPTGSDSGYDSSGSQMGGGSPYGGNTPPAQGNNPILALMNNPNSLTTDQKTKLQTVLTEILKDCIGLATYNNLTSNGHKFDFSIKSDTQPQASYSPTNQSITIKDPSTLSTFNLQEEFFHAYQNFNIPGGNSQYGPGKTGSANIEFEAKVLRDMNILMNYQTGQLALTSDGYTNFLKDITNNYSSLPTSFTSSQSTQYFGFMGEFLQQTAAYSMDIIKSDLNPTAMFKLITNSTCPTH